MGNFISQFRILESGLTNFWRNIWLSLAATTVMTITLVIFSVLGLLFHLTSFSAATIRERVDISAYFKVGIAESEVLKIKDEIAKDPRVKSITYVSAEEAFDDFKSKHQDDGLISSSLGELTENPLPATLQIKAAKLDDYPAIAEELSSGNYQDKIDKVNFEDNRIVIERLNSLLKFIATFGSILVAIFSFIAIVVIFNTITLTIYNRREEVEIMRLVGATNSYIRGPFIIEALMYSILATVITALLLIPVYAEVLPAVNNYLNPGAQSFTSEVIRYPFLVILELIIAVALSIISTFMAMRKYLRV